MIFETSRLLVRELVSSDFTPFHEMQGDTEVMRFTSGEGFSEEENRRQLDDCIEKYSKPESSFWVWAIVSKSDSQFLGTCAIVPEMAEDAPDPPRPEIGYRFLRKHFGNGYGQEICDGLIKHAIETMKLNDLVAYVDVRNVASVKILDRSQLTFVEEKTTETGVVDRIYLWIPK